MIIVTRIVELIVKYRNSELAKDEIKELREWIGQQNEHLILFRDLTDDDYLFAECTRMLEGDKKASWKKLEQKFFKSLSDAPNHGEMPEVSLPEKPGGPPPALKHNL